MSPTYKCHFVCQLHWSVYYKLSAAGGNWTRDHHIKTSARYPLSYSSAEWWQSYRWLPSSLGRRSDSAHTGHRKKLLLQFFFISLSTPWGRGESYTYSSYIYYLYLRLPDGFLRPMWGFAPRWAPSSKSALFCLIDNFANVPNIQMPLCMSVALERIIN